MGKKRRQMVEVVSDRKTGEKFLKIQLTDKIRRQLAPKSKKTD